MKGCKQRRSMKEAKPTTTTAMRRIETTNGNDVLNYDEWSKREKVEERIQQQ